MIGAFGCDPFGKTFKPKFPRPTILIIDRGVKPLCKFENSPTSKGSSPELWTNTNDECGARCDEQMNFVKNFKRHAQILQKGRYSLFTPHYITCFCPKECVSSKQCKSQCINQGRYCAPDPEQDFGDGVGKEINKSWVWWDYVTDFHIRCSMKEKKYSKECAESVVKSLGLPLDKIKKCMGDPGADVENENGGVSSDLMADKEVSDRKEGTELADHGALVDQIRISPWTKNHLRETQVVELSSSGFGTGNPWNSDLKLTSPRSSSRSVLYPPPKASMKTSLLEDSLGQAHVLTPQPHRTSTGSDDLAIGNRGFPLLSYRTNHVPRRVMYSSLLLQTVSTGTPFAPYLAGHFFDSDAVSFEDGFVSSRSRPVVSPQASDEYNRIPVDVPCSFPGGLRVSASHMT
ncbi:hypothetical protein Bca52824_018197 [Brassica carinata]|uniref:Vacuolar sorting receptor thioredoxin-like domain-containing protein n=1 Tax=Brassica carinata TaxID=52824 RepID=A0A8X7VQG6_BRACI|nr:hypothetical protein Bca52824_018197 [Brassica carinata]